MSPRLHGGSLSGSESERRPETKVKKTLKAERPVALKKEVDKRIELAGAALHDDIGPLLSAAGLRLQLLRMDFPETASQVREITQALDEVIDRVRAISQVLKPSPFSVKRSRGPKREYN
jgi:signal transduction histidine kinase